MFRLRTILFRMIWYVVSAWCAMSMVGGFVLGRVCHQGDALIHQAVNSFKATAKSRDQHLSLAA